MRKKIRLTQKHIVTFIMLFVSMFALLMIMNLMTGFFPPLITHTSIIEENQEYITVRLKGRFSRRKDYSAKIMVNSQIVEDSDILLWKKRNITYRMPQSEEILHLVQVRIHEKNSNKKLMLRASNDNTLFLDEGEYQYLEKNSAPTRITVSALMPYQALRFIPAANASYRYSIYTHNSPFEYPLPKYIADQSESLLRIYLHEHIWFNQEKSVRFFIRQGEEVYKYHIDIAQIYHDDIYHVRSYKLKMAYPSTGRNNLMALPISTTYQHTHVLDNSLAEALMNNKSYLPLYGNAKNISVISNIMRGSDAFRDVIPVFYDGEMPLQYLFAKVSQEDSAILSEFTRKVQNETIENISINNMKISSQFTQKDIHAHYTINASKEIAVKDKQTLDAYLPQYIIRLIELFQDAQDTQFNDLSLVKILETNSSLNINDINTRATLIKNMAVAAFLRSQGIVARTIIGLDVSDILLEDNTERTNNTYVSWLEILSKNRAWVGVNELHFFERKEKEIALVVAEEFARKTANNQHPYMPLVVHADIENAF